VKKRLRSPSRGDYAWNSIDAAKRDATSKGCFNEFIGSKRGTLPAENPTACKTGRMEAASAEIASGCGSKRLRDIGRRDEEGGGE